MFDFGVRENEILTVDLHQMRTGAARQWLQGQVSRAPKEIKEIHVIHGYRGGTALRDMVRKSFQHPRVKEKVLGCNPGTTILVLK